MPQNLWGEEENTSAVKEPSYYHCNWRTLVMENQGEEHNKNTTGRKMRMFMYIRLRFKTFKSLACIVHKAMDGSWVCDQRSVASSSWTLHLCPQAWEWAWRTTSSTFSSLEPWGKVLLTFRVLFWVVSSQFLLYIVEYALPIVVTGAWLLGLGLWEKGKDGKMIPKLYIETDDTSHRLIVLLTESRGKNKSPFTFSLPLSGSLL